MREVTRRTIGKRGRKCHLTKPERTLFVLEKETGDASIGDSYNDRKEAKAFGC